MQKQVEANKDFIYKYSFAHVYSWHLMAVSMFMLTPKSQGKQMETTWFLALDGMVMVPSHVLDPVVVRASKMTSKTSSIFASPLTHGICR